MTTATTNPPFAIGFLSILEIEVLGFCGGYLILNRNGRPLEFHCALPLKIDRAQQILFGTSLRSFLLSEHIGPALCAKAKTVVEAVFVDSPDAMSLRKNLSVPVARVELFKTENTEKNDSASSVPGCENMVELASYGQIKTPQIPGPRRCELMIQDHRSDSCGYRIGWLQEYHQDSQVIQSAIGQIVEDVNLDEPFQRIHEAIYEAHSVAA